MSKSYSAIAWFWIVAGDESQVYSSALPGFVPATDPGYVAWREEGGIPTRIAALDELRDVLMQQHPAGWLPSLDEAKAAALAKIDAAAGTARARYITIAPGQEATYLLKAAQAVAFNAGGYAGTVPGLVQAEVDATGASPQQASDAILAQQAAWEVKAAQIESARRRGKVTAGAALDLATVAAARDAALTELAAL